MSALVLTALVRANLALAAAILLVLLLRRPVRARFGALAAYALWLVAPLCAAVGLLPAHAPPQALAPVTVLARAVSRSAAPLVHKGPVLPTALVVAWAAGAGLTLALLLIRQRRFTASLGRLRPSQVEPGLLLAERRDFGPAVIGALRPRIVAPADFEQRFQGAARAVVLTHEQVHLARGDAAINALAAMLRCLCWFNPLVHVAVRRMQVDQEIACDEAVVARHPQDRRVYAQALLDTLLVSHA
ncbi:M56 family metallopeptidase, partial [Caulobacter sp.]|uniref:M56 family metallopeptidase n=1 Tax=Caulobacter sp. TaxID=78 RepID=UPI001B296F78